MTKILLYETYLYDSICDAKTLLNVFSTKHHLQTESQLFSDFRNSLKLCPFKTRLK